MDNIDKLNSLLQKCITTDHSGVTSIHHPYYEFEISDTTRYTVEQINQLFLKQKAHIDTLKKINQDLREFIITNDQGISSIHHYEFEVLDISRYAPEEINELFSKHKELLKNYAESGQYKEYILSIPERARVSAFLRLSEKRQAFLNDKDYWEFVKFLWTEYSENVFKDRDNWWFMFRNKRSQREFFMNQSERSFLNNLPDKFIVYRGYSRPKPTDRMNPRNLKWWNHRDTFSRMGFSYTLSKEVGLKYFDKYSIYNRENPPDTSYYKYENELFEGEVTKDRVLFYNNGKNEEEIIIVDEFSEYGNPY